MQVKIGLAVVVALLGWSAAGAEEGCRGEFDRSLEHYIHVVDSLRLDKPGQAHVYARDGLEFTPAEAYWLQGQIREIETSCSLHAAADALQRLERARRLIDTRAKR
jgi:hypothetical protein